MRRRLVVRDINKEEVKKKGLDEESQLNQHQNVDLLSTPDIAQLLYDGDPDMIQHRLRPTICKDPKGIMREDEKVKWLKNARYVSIRNMDPQDCETLRLAQYEQDHNAQLVFCDVAPHYRLTKDLWCVSTEVQIASHEGSKSEASTYQG